MKLRWPILGFALILAFGILYIGLSPDGKPKPPSKTGSSPPARSQQAARSEKQPTQQAPVSSETDFSEQIEDAAERLQESGNPESSAAILRDLHQTLSGGESAAVADAIHRFLKTRKDAPTRLPFSVAPGGNLETAPSLRIALLDWLQKFDPSIALEVSRQIMDEKQSPDEYAVALRNLAWNDLEGDLKKELSDRLDQMLQVSDWKQNPSAGFLEALDASVELADDQTFSEILQLSQEASQAANRDLSRAAFLTLDRMAVRDPNLVLRSFQSNALAGASPEQRASLLSRLDLALPAHRESLEKYLSSADFGSEELDYFAEIFPNGNYIHGNWLITAGEVTHSIASRLEADRRALAEIEKWIAQGVVKQSNKTIVRIRERLQVQIEAADQQ